MEGSGVGCHTRRDKGGEEGEETHCLKRGKFFFGMRLWGARVVVGITYLV